jgi:soluble lytic murein transglycosylase-like protein
VPPIDCPRELTRRAAEVARALGIASAAAALLAVPARAELWGYVDGRGVAHVAPRPLDARYQPLLGPPASTHGRVPGKAVSAGTLATWLQFAPEARATRALLYDAARRHGVDAALMLALIAVESGFDARAVSPRGALGLMQIMPATADHYATPSEARRPAAERLLDPRVNVETGARILADLTRRHGRPDLVLAAWNAGGGHVRRHGNAVPPFRETQAHVGLVLELYWALLQQAQARRAQTLVVWPTTAPVSAPGTPPTGSTAAAPPAG